MYETEPNIKENSIHESTRTQRCNANENQGGVKEHQNGSDVKKNSNTVHKQPRSGQQISPKTEKANRQHVGKSFGTDGADVVTPKVDASDRGIDLKREAGKGRCCEFPHPKTDRFLWLNCCAKVFVSSLCPFLRGLWDCFCEVFVNRLYNNLLLRYLYREIKGNKKIVI